MSCQESSGQVTDLPSSAVAILRITYKSITSGKNLTYQQRRILWKKYKRKKKRIINHFALSRLHHKSFGNPFDTDDAESQSSSDLPKGPLTNANIINYLKENQKKPPLVGILRSTTREREISDGNSVENVDKTDYDHSNVSTFKQEQDDVKILHSTSKHREEKEDDQLDSSKSFCEIHIEEDAVSLKESRLDSETHEIAQLLAQLDEEVEQWQNPSPPADYQEAMDSNQQHEDFSAVSSVDHKSSNHLEDNRPPCLFFTKTGACRFGDRCSKKHEVVGFSDTLLFPNMFGTFLFDLEDRLRVAGDAHDLSLEHSEQDLYDEFLEFFHDIHPEFYKIGRLSNLYVCKNRCQHLRGNVYVQYFSEKDAKECANKMRGRYFGGKPLVCNYVKISSWASTLCGIDNRTGKCSRGGQCNYLHVFKMSYSDRYDRFKCRKKSRSPHSHRKKKRSRIEDEEYSNKRKRKSLRRSPSISDHSHRKKKSKRRDSKSPQNAESDNVKSIYLYDKQHSSVKSHKKDKRLHKKAVKKSKKKKKKDRSKD